MRNVHNSEVLIHLKNIERPDQDCLKINTSQTTLFDTFFYVGDIKIGLQSQNIKLV